MFKLFYLFWLPVAKSTPFYKQRSEVEVTVYRVFLTIVATDSVRYENGKAEEKIQLPLLMFIVDIT